MKLQEKRQKFSTLIWTFALVTVLAVAIPEFAYSAEDGDEEASETVVVYSKKKKERGGACASCGSITFRIPNSASLARGKTTVDYETTRKPNEADAALLYQCASLLEQIIASSNATWLNPSDTVRKGKNASKRNDLIKQFNDKCSGLFPDNPDLAMDTANAAYDSN